jgi:hypothetical protein
MPCAEAVQGGCRVALMSCDLKNKFHERVNVIAGWYYNTINIFLGYANAKWLKAHLKAAHDRIDKVVKENSNGSEGTL